MMNLQHHCILWILLVMGIIGHNSKMKMNEEEKVSGAREREREGVMEKRTQITTKTTNIP